MTIAIKLLAGAAALAGIAAPAAAQYYPPQQSYPQQGYAYPQQGYGQPGYQQQGGIAGIINQLLGNRYNVTDRTAVTQCAAAAQAQAAAQYRPNPYGQYGQQNYPQYQGQQGYGQAYNPYAAMQSARVTSITNVERRSNGLRVSGLMSSGMASAYGQPGYGQGNAYGTPYGQNAYNPAYANAMSDLSFRCNVDYRGQVTNVRVRRNTAYGRR